MIEQNCFENEDAAVIEETVDWVSSHIKKDFFIDQLANIRKTILQVIERYRADMRKYRNARRQTKTRDNANILFLLWCSVIYPSSDPVYTTRAFAFFGLL